MKLIETLENWNILATAMKEKGWRLWQTQFIFDNEEGFHAWFRKDNKPEVEVVTHNEEVQKAIISYNSWTP